MTRCADERASKAAVQNVNRSRAPSEPGRQRTSREESPEREAKPSFLSILREALVSRFFRKGWLHIQQHAASTQPREAGHASRKIQGVNGEHDKHGQKQSQRKGYAVLRGVPIVVMIGSSVVMTVMRVRVVPMIVG